MGDSTFSWTPSRKVVAVGCLAGAIGTYIRAVGFGFVYDDHLQILTNPQLQSWTFLTRIFTSQLWSREGFERVGYYYRPIFSFWLFFIHAVGGLSSVAWHASNIGLHLTVIYIVFKLSLSLLKDLTSALCTATVFAIHPINIESVCWVSASDEILYSLLLLASILILIRISLQTFRQSSGLALSLLLWAAALFAKETAISLLLVFFFLNYRSSTRTVGSSKPGFRAALVKSIPYLAIALVFLGARFLVLQGFGLSDGRQSWAEVFFTAPSLLIFYIGKLLWPTGLSGFYVNPVHSIPTLVTWLQSGAIILALGILCWVAFRRSIVVGVAVGMILLPLLPVLVGVRVFRLGDLAHDRYLYLPSVGLSLLIGLAIKRISEHRNGTRYVLVPLGGTVFALLMWLNVTQQSFYRDDEAFFRRGLQIGPTNVLVMDYLGNYYMRQKQPELALEQFKNASEKAPENANVQFAYAKGLFETKQYELAEPHFVAAVQSTGLPEERREISKLCLAQIEIRTGNLSLAEATLLELQSSNPSLPLLHDTLGTLYEMRGHLPDALREYVSEFKISGTRASREKAIRLAHFLRSQQYSVN